MQMLRAPAAQQGMLLLDPSVLSEYADSRHRSSVFSWPELSIFRRFDEQIDRVLLASTDCVNTQNTRRPLYIRQILLYLISLHTLHDFIHRPVSWSLTSRQ
jgi:hypothetical protein